ncbi:type II toxin-antitoxin system PemK/MazF family toxin [Mycobacterium sp. AT1]|uniref:type II toxin-antitoxin system PemK/MazF family toxin n=1 Tax=Mycobacterium sp. AT1 TaxID=1961706 RepID=UPI0009ADFD20|nr:type II toxin-antitoxin system PemK/MazF family toxin [Mycobacterium sp. AT1]OPX10808.1 mRNA interferase MazF3 [Mycobacterium sp. AT1]
MRPIHVAQLDKARPVLILTRELVRPHPTRVTVAPITGTVRGLSTEVPVGVRNGLEKDSAVSVDDIVTIPVTALGVRSFFLPDQEELLTTAIQHAFDLD